MITHTHLCRWNRFLFLHDKITIIFLYILLFHNLLYRCRNFSCWASSHLFHFICDYRYGREDTHYLLYIYDLMKIELSKLPKESEDSDPPLVEVWFSQNIGIFASLIQFLWKLRTSLYTRYFALPSFMLLLFYGSSKSWELVCVWAFVLLNYLGVVNLFVMFHSCIVFLGNMPIYPREMVKMQVLKLIAMYSMSVDVFGWV